MKIWGMEIRSCPAEVGASSLSESESESEEVRGLSHPEALLVDVSVGFSPHIIEPTPPPPPENGVNEGEFSVSELVWGKVKSHPWWPGQIFDSCDASQRAIKCKKKDSFLVAYFGDQTFAWNNASSLKHFESHFSLMEKQTNSQPFCTAVDSALNELGTRLVLGMLCPCTPNHLFKSSHLFHNAGIRTPASSPPTPNSKPSFHPAKLLNLLKTLATNPLAAPDRLQLKIAHSQLMVFFCLKGYSQLPQFHACGGLLDDDDDPNLPHLLSQTQNFNPSRNSHPSNKKKSLSDLLAGTKVTSSVHHRASSKSMTSSGRRKRMAVASSSQGLAVKSIKGMSSVPTGSPASAPQSFKVGECIRRIASQLTGSPPILKFSAQKFQIDQNEGTNNPQGSHTSLIVPHEYSSPDVMLSQLCLAARDPMKGYSFLSIVVDFFSDFRNSISLEHATSLKQKKYEKTGHRIRKQCNTNNISKETFDFEEMSDSYWTDMVIQSSPEEQLSHRSRKRKQISDFVVPTELDGSSYEDEDPLQLSLVLDFQGKNRDDDYLYADEKPSRKSCKKKKNARIMLPLDKQAVVAEETMHRLNDNKYGNDFSPTALLMSFMESDSVPSEMNLNKIFRRFGPLKESETKVLRDTGSATVIFKKQSDAEVAFSSAAKFSIFGPVRVSYQLRFQV